jgi:hypothetical protein
MSPPRSGQVRAAFLFPDGYCTTAGSRVRARGNGVASKMPNLSLGFFTFGFGTFCVEKKRSKPLLFAWSALPGTVLRALDTLRDPHTATAQMWRAVAARQQEPLELGGLFVPAEVVAKAKKPTQLQRLELRLVVVTAPSLSL